MELKEVVIHEDGFYEAHFGKWVDVSEYLPNPNLSPHPIAPYLVWVSAGYADLATWCAVDEVFWRMDGDPANDDPLDVLFWQPVSIPKGQMLHNGAFSKYDVLFKEICRQREIIARGSTSPNGKAVN